MKRKKIRKVKVKEKSLFVAVALNSLIWGLGYIYLKKKMKQGIFALTMYILIWISSFFYIFNAGQLVFAGIFWISFWSTWVSIFLAYDAYKISVKKNELY